MIKKYLIPVCPVTLARGGAKLSKIAYTHPILSEERQVIVSKFYDRKHDSYEAALLTRYYTQHALRPYIDSEINHIRHFIKLPFIEKGIEFIDLPSIFRDNNFILAIPSYFENTESPIICYQYNKPICNTILNFNKLVSDLDIVKILNFVINQRVILSLVT